MKNNHITLNGYMSIKYASILLEGVDCLLECCIESGAPVKVLNLLNDSSHNLAVVLHEFRKACGSFDGIKRD